MLVRGKVCFRHGGWWVGPSPQTQTATPLHVFSGELCEAGMSSLQPLMWVTVETLEHAARA